MFDDVLIESAGKDKKKGGWITALISAIIHLGIVGAIVAAGLLRQRKPGSDREADLGLHRCSPRLPRHPLPHLPPRAAAARPKPKVETPREETPREQFRQPTEMPQDVPEVADVAVGG